MDYNELEKFITAAEAEGISARLSSAGLQMIRGSHSHMIAWEQLRRGFAPGFDMKAHIINQLVNPPEPGAS
jgi:hypothetical protein